MNLSIRFDTKNNEEIITFETEEKRNIRLKLGSSFIDFLSLDLGTILNEETISTMSKSNYKDILSKIEETTKGIIIPEIIDIGVSIDILSENINLNQIKKYLKSILKTYKEFKVLLEFCYFSNEFKNATPFQKYIYYLNKFGIDEVTLPKQSITSFALKPKRGSKKLLKDNDILVMLKNNSPFLYYNYVCNSINDYMLVSFLELIKNNYLILKCKNCGKYFIPYNRTDTLYCDRISPKDTSKTCKQYGIDKAWLDRTKDKSDWYSFYRRVYQSFQMKAKRNPEIKQKAFDNFRNEFKQKKKDLNEGKITTNELISWLEEIKNK